MQVSPMDATGHDISEFRERLREELGVSKSEEEPFVHFLSAFASAWYTRRHASWDALEQEFHRFWQTRTTEVICEEETANQS